MKKTLFKRIKHSLLAVACMTMSFSPFVSFAEDKDLPAVFGSVLEDSVTYVVKPTDGTNTVKIGPKMITNKDKDGKDIETQDPEDAGKSALIVEGHVTLRIPKGVTLEVTGGAGDGTIGGGAGILVPGETTGASEVSSEDDSESKTKTPCFLAIIGEGTLIAKGGNAGNGTDGGNGNYGRSTADTKHDEAYGGAGGKGGAGGGGAGAGIGGNGGNGAEGGAGGKEIHVTEAKPDYSSGENGKNGADGQAGHSCGNILISSHVTLDASGGKKGTDGKSGIGLEKDGKTATTGEQEGMGAYSYFKAGTFEDYSYGGGGGSGSGGRGGQRAANVGLGGGAGGSGAGGGSGAAMCNDSNDSPMDSGGSGANSGQGQGFKQDNTLTNAKRQLKWPDKDYKNTYAGEAGKPGVSAAAGEEKSYMILTPPKYTSRVQVGSPLMSKAPSITMSDGSAPPSSLSITYSLDFDKPLANWSNNVLKAESAGEQTVYYRVSTGKDDGNISYTDSITTTVTANAAEDAKTKINNLPKGADLLSSLVSLNNDFGKEVLNSLDEETKAKLDTAYKARDIILQINSIGTVTKDSEDKIQKVRTAYNGLSGEAKNFVGDVLQTLENAEAEYKKISGQKDEPTEAEPTEAEPTEAEPTEAEPTEAEPTEAEPTEAEPTEAEPTEAEPTEAPADVDDPTKKKTSEKSTNKSGSSSNGYGYNYLYKATGDFINPVLIYGLIFSFQLLLLSFARKKK